ncbi:MAG: hypothetical protein WC767_00760 [Candidatus Paceibacterota bacterium]|jgi:hypothetical protein
MKPTYRIISMLSVLIGITSIATAQTAPAPLGASDPVAQSIDSENPTALAFKSTGLYVVIGDTSVELFQVNALASREAAASHISRYGFKEPSAAEIQAWTAQFGNDKLTGKTRIFATEASQDQKEFARRRRAVSNPAGQVKTPAVVYSPVISTDKIPTGMTQPPIEKIDKEALVFTGISHEIGGLKIDLFATTLQQGIAEKALHKIGYSLIGPDKLPAFMRMADVKDKVAEIEKSGQRAYCLTPLTGQPGGS